MLSTPADGLAIIEGFAENEGLEYVLQFGDLEEWYLRWMENGWQDDDGRDMNQGVIYRDNGTKRLLPRWASMLLGLERGYRRQAGTEDI